MSSADLNKMTWKCSKIEQVSKISESKYLSLDCSFVKLQLRLKIHSYMIFVHFNQKSAYIKLDSCSCSGPFLKSAKIILVFEKVKKICYLWFDTNCTVIIFATSNDMNRSWGVSRYQKGPIMLISTYMFLFWDSTGVALHDSQFKKVLIYVKLIYSPSAEPLTETYHISSGLLKSPLSVVRALSDQCGGSERKLVAHC